MAIVVEPWTATPSTTDWTRVRGSVALTRVASDNTGYAPSATNENYRRNFDLGGLAQFAECPIVAAGADNNRTAFLHLRMTLTGSTPSSYSVTFNAQAGTIGLLRYNTPTSVTPLLTGVGVTVPATPFLLRMEVEGATLRGLIAGDVVISTTDSGTALTGTAPGLAFYNCGTNSPPLLRVGQFRAGLLTDSVVDGPELGRGLLAA